MIGRRVLRLLVLAAVSLVVAAGAAQAERRLALVIGNDSYAELTPLRKAVADATSFAALLEEKAFDKVILRTNVSGTAMDDAIAEFLDAIQPGDVAVFFYSGHGWSDGSQNFLIPVDVPKVTTETLLIRRSVPLQNGVNGVIDEITRRGATLKVVIIDACRDNPFTAQIAGRNIGLGRGLSRVDAPSGTFVVFSAGAGQTALDRLSDSDADPNSVFTRTLLPRLRADMPLLDAVKEVQSEVYELAGRISHAQEPAYYDQVRGDVCLSGNCRRIAVDPPGPQVPPGGFDVAAAYAAARDLDTIEGWTAFLQYCRDSVYCSLAEAAKRKLEQVARIPDPVVPDPVAIAAAQTAAECDRLAAHSSDNQRPPGIAGVAFADIEGNPSPAIAACRAAAAAFPNEIRYAYQLARSLDAAKNYAEAFPLYRRASDAGYVAASFSLGFMYDRGLGMTANQAEAFRLYEIAAKAGHVVAMYNSGVLLRDGLGVARDPLRARDWFEKATAQNYPSAFTALGRLHETGDGVPAASDSEAFRLYQRAAELSDPTGMYNLGVFYENGRGTPKSVEIAADWYRRAAEAGYNSAQHKLGFFYDSGIGVPQDYDLAEEWYRKAADGGNSGSMHNIGRLYRDGLGRAKDPAEARRWFERGVEANGRDAMFALAAMLTQGDGGNRDLARAAELYASSLRAGYQWGIEQFRTNSSAYPVEARRAVQRMLISAGYLQGSADGVIGSESRDALARLSASFN